MTGSITARPPDRNAFRPGDTVDVSFEWLLESAPESVEARLIWFTRGVGTQDVGLVESQPALSAVKGEHRARFKLPLAPYSFSGRLVSLVWAVELIADDLAERWEFVMAPDGREVVLPQTIPMDDITAWVQNARAGKPVQI